jgi:putative hemolysin
MHNASNKIASQNFTEKVANEITDEIYERAAHYTPNVSMSLDVGPFLIETAKDYDDLLSIAQLREHSFYADFRSQCLGLDVYDLTADHIVVRDKMTNQILSSYRIICSEFDEQFFSPVQFEMSNFLQTPETKIELGRATVHRDYRNGLALNMVWKGLANYAKLVNARYIFGCASAKTTSPEMAYSIFWHLYTSFYDDQFEIRVLPKFQFPIVQACDVALPWAEVESGVPSLLKSYLKAGATICSEPALDMQLGCVDYITILDLEKLTPKYKKRFFGEEA